METVIEVLHQGARNYGDMPYLGGKTGDQWRIYSFIESDRISSAFAAALVKRGFKKGDNVSILSEGRPSWVISEFGLLKAGCVSVPLSTKLLEEEIVFRLEHSESKAFLVSENNFQKAADAVKQIRSKPVLILISPRSSHSEELTEKFGFGGDVQYFDELIDEGEKLLTEENYPDKLAEINKTIGLDDTVTISYTSGTTGNPKGIMLSHRNYIHNALNAMNVVQVKKGWKTLVMLPLDHSFAHTVGLYVCAIVGMTMYFVDAQGGPMAALRNLPKNLLEVNPNFLLTVPALSGNFMKKMIQGVSEKGGFIKGLFEAGLKAGIARAGNGYNKPPFFVRLRNYFPWAVANALIFPKLRAVFGKEIKFCIGGGALLEIKQQEFFHAIGAPVYQGYGLTENSPIICSNSPAKHKFGTSGVIITDLDVRIMKDKNTECPLGEIGEIVTRGGSVMKGYYKNPEATAETLIDGWLWSGDLGYKDPDGFLVVTGREKALLIAADGEKYSPETIEEAVINTSKFVNQIMAFNEQCKFTSALITLNSGELKAAVKNLELSVNSDEDLDKIINLIREDLCGFVKHPDYSGSPPQWRPASFAIFPGIFDENNGLVNSTMKLVRYKVRDFYKSRIDEIYAAGTANPLLPGNREALRSLLGE
ncbi:MAG: AMP-binding protein [Treponema sp.]|jgi:long-chain acyl-CoA synthetase|nr:AMP-binding protein [Treponema sp.]